MEAVFHFAFRLVDKNALTLGFVNVLVDIPIVTFLKLS